MRISQLTACLLLAFTAVSAAAMDRLFPSNVKRGVVSFESYPTVTVDGKVRDLSAGLRIWNASNLTQTQAAYTGMKFLANYTEDNMGQLNRIWILTDSEAQQPLAGASNSSGTSGSTTSPSTTTSTTSSTQ